MTVGSKEMPTIKNALDTEALDVTSAYAPEQGHVKRLRSAQ